VTVHFSTIDIDRAPEGAGGELLPVVDEICTFFEKWAGARVPATRIGRYREAFTKYESIGRIGNRLSFREAQNLIETVVELQQLRKIMQAATLSSKPGAWREQIRTLTAGVPYASDDRAAASPRDTQFECFVGAVAELSGYDIAFSEPDLQLSYENDCYCIAAKRPRTAETVAKNCKIGSKQIRTAGVPGLVALDLSLALHRGACPVATAPEAGIQFLKDSLNAFVSRHYRSLVRACGDRVSAVLLSAHVPVLIFDATGPTSLRTVVRWLLVPLSYTMTSSLRLALEFTARSEQGLFGKWTPDEAQNCGEPPNSPQKPTSR